MKTFLQALILAFVFFSVARPQPLEQDVLRDFFLPSGMAGPDEESLSRLSWLTEFRKSFTGGLDELLQLANSSSTSERRLFLALQQAYSIPSQPPQVTPGRSWPVKQSRWRIDHKRRVSLEEGDIDYLIVGSGPTGSVLAYCLSEAGFRTVLIERGSLVNPGTVDTRSLPFLKTGGGAVPTVDSHILVRNGVAVGGGATVNVDLAFSPELDFVARRVADWNLPLFQQDKVQEAYLWVKQMIGTRTPSYLEINENNRILWNGAEDTGLIPGLYDLNMGEDVEKLGPTERLLRKALDQGYPLHIVSDLDVRRVLTKGQRAIGVEAVQRTSAQHPAVVVAPDNFPRTGAAPLHFNARSVILSAGTQGTAALLLRSKLGGPKVGRGVLLHPSLPLIGRFEQLIDNQLGTPSTVYAIDPARPYLLFECMAGDPSYASFMLFGSAAERGALLREFRYLGGFGVLLVDEVNHNNRIEIDDRGEPEVYYELERERFVEGVALGLETMLAAGALEVYVPTTEPLNKEQNWNGRLQPIRTSSQIESLRKNLKCIPGRTVITSAHMQGSCKMGKDSKLSVVDPGFRVWNYHNLYVCDTSVFPTSVGANPMQMAYTTGKILSNELTRHRPNDLSHARMGGSSRKTRVPTTPKFINQQHHFQTLLTK